MEDGIYMDNPSEINIYFLSVGWNWRDNTEVAIYVYVNSKFNFFYYACSKLNAISSPSPRFPLNA